MENLSGILGGKNGDGKIKSKVTFQIGKLHIDKEAEKENRETLPFTIATNHIKCLGVNLVKQVKDLYDKNFQSLKKEIEEAIRKWKALQCSWIGRINVIKMTILPIANYRTKVPTQFSTDLERRALNFLWKNKKLRIDETIL